MLRLSYRNSYSKKYHGPILVGASLSCCDAIKNQLSSPLQGCLFLTLWNWEKTAWQRFCLFPADIFIVLFCWNNEVSPWFLRCSGYLSFWAHCPVWPSLSWRGRRGRALVTFSHCPASEKIGQPQFPGFPVEFWPEEMYLGTKNILKINLFSCPFNA